MSTALHQDRQDVASNDAVGLGEATAEFADGRAIRRLSAGAALALGRRQAWYDLKTGIPLAFGDLASVLLAVAVARITVGSNATVNAPAFAIGIGCLTVFLQHIKKLYPACGTEHAIEFRSIVENACVIAAFSAVALLLSRGASFAIVQFWTVFSTLLFLGLALVRPLVRRLLADCDWWTQPVVILGNGRDSRVLHDRLERTRHEGLRPVGIIFDPSPVWEGGPGENSGQDSGSESELNEEPGRIRRIHEAEGLRGPRSPRTRAVVGTWLGPVSELESILLGVGSSRLVVTGDREDYHAFQGIPHVTFPTSLKHHPTRQVRLAERDHFIELHSFSGLTSPGALTIKRGMDLLLILGSVVFWFPVMVAIAVLIKIQDPGPIFFRQRRVGRFGKPFYAIKFRSMVCDAERKLGEYLDEHPEMRREWERTHKLRKDPRVTKIGAFLRKTSLDEIPQLINVLKGEMSLVGPRPIIDGTDYDEEYIKNHPEVFELYRLVRPGITGLWQVSGRNSTAYIQRVMLDRFYLHNWSITFDIYILWRTIKTALLREGAC